MPDFVYLHLDVVPNSVTIFGAVLSVGLGLGGSDYLNTAPIGSQNLVGHRIWHNTGICFK